MMKNMEPDHLEERIKKELVSLGLCDEAEVTTGTHVVIAMYSF